VTGFDNFIDDRTVRQAHNALSDKAWIAEMAEHNYDLGRRHYSYDVLADKLRILVAEAAGR